MATVLAFSGFGDTPMKFYNTDGTAHADPASAPVEPGAGCSGITVLSTGKVATFGGGNPNFPSTGCGLFNADFSVFSELFESPVYFAFPNSTASADALGNVYGMSFQYNPFPTEEVVILQYDATGYVATHVISTVASGSFTNLGVSPDGTMAYYALHTGGVRPDTVYAFDLSGDTLIGVFVTETGFALLPCIPIVVLASGDVIIAWEGVGLGALGKIVRYNSAGAAQATTYAMSGSDTAPTAMSMDIDQAYFWVAYYDSTLATYSGVQIVKYTVSSGAIVEQWAPDDGSFEFDGPFTVVDMADAPFLTINGVEVFADAPTFRILKTAGRQARCNFDLPAHGATATPDVDDTIVCTELGIYRIFGGLADDVYALEAGRVSRRHQVTAVGYAGYANFRTNVTEVRPSETLAARIEYFRATYLDVYGVTLDAGQVTGPTLDGQTYDGMVLTDVFNDITQNSGGYLWNISDYKVLSFALPTSLAAPFDITDGTGPLAQKDVRVRKNTIGTANRVFVKFGAAGVSRVTFYFTGDGILDTFTLPMLINGPLPYGAGDAAVGEALVVGPLGPGLTESLGGPTAALQWQYDPTVPTAPTIFRPAGAVPNGNVFSVSYNAEFPATVSDEDGSAATNPRELTIRRPDITDPTIAAALATELLAIALIAGVEVEYETWERGIEPGMTQTIDLSLAGISSQTFTITQVEIRIENGRLKRFVRASAGDIARVELLPQATFDTWNGVGLAP